jgi:hypothetical protein
MPVEDFIITVYCCIADSYADLVTDVTQSLNFATQYKPVELP